MAVRLGRLAVVLEEGTTGDSRPVRGMVLTQEGTVEAWVKPVADLQRVQVEVACSLLGQLLDLPVPEPLVVFIGPEFGGPSVGFGSGAVGHPNVARWMDTEADVVLKRLREWAKVVDAACFDEWIGNCDRHPGNLIYDGQGFWLIDHDKAMHPLIQLDALSPANQLFDFVVHGADESRLLKLQQLVGASMHDMQRFSVQDLIDQTDSAAWPPATLIPLRDWLAERQNHLARLGNDRVPAKQLGVI
ncbi:hypothetical protein IAE56_16840 [Stenotrophomonas sp. S41]|nr:hypothetical protein [Stenotrophomonas sp. S41]